MAELKCTMCGAKLNVVDGVTVVECEYCGTKQTVATSAVITSSLNKPQKSSGVNKAVIFSAAGCVSVLFIIIIALIISGNGFKLSNVGAYDDSSQITVEQYEKGDEHNNELKNNDNTSSVLSQLETPNSNPDNVSTPNTSVENDDNQVTSQHAQNPSNSQQTPSQSSQTPTTPSNPCASGHKWEEATCTTAARCSVCKKTSGSPLGHEILATKCTICGYTDYSEIAGTYVDVSSYYLDGGEEYEMSSSFTVDNSGILKFEIENKSYSFKIVQTGNDYGWEAFFDCYYLDGSKETDANVRITLNNNTICLLHFEWEYFNGRHIYFNGENLSFNKK